MRRSGTIWGTVLVLVLGMFALLLPGGARAQTGEGGDQIPELSQDWNVRVGLYVLQSKTARGRSGEVGFSGNVERRVYAGRGYDVNIGIGYNGYDQIYSVPITANIIAFNGNVRYGAGAGYAFGRRNNDLPAQPGIGVGNQFGTSTTRGTSGTVLDLLLGYQLTHGRNPLSVDLRYFFIGGSSDSLDGYSLTLGMKF